MIEFAHCMTYDQKYDNKCMTNNNEKYDENYEYNCAERSTVVR